MGSMYTSVIDGLSVSAIADLFYLKAASNRAAVIHEIRLTQETSETSEQLPLKLFRTATDNSANGTANTPAPLNPNAAAAAGATVRTNITGASLAAETTLLRVEAENVLGGWHYLPTPEDRIVVPAGGSFAVKLKTAPSAALTLSGVLIFEEIG